MNASQQVALYRLRMRICPYCGSRKRNLLDSSKCGDVRCNKKFPKTQADLDELLSFFADKTDK